MKAARFRSCWAGAAYFEVPLLLPEPIPVEPAPVEPLPVLELGALGVVVPGVVLLGALVLPAPLVLPLGVVLCSCRQRSFSRPVSVSQRVVVALGGLFGLDGELLGKDGALVEPLDEDDGGVLVEPL